MLGSYQNEMRIISLGSRQPIRQVLGHIACALAGWIFTSAANLDEPEGSTPRSSAALDFHGKVVRDGGADDDLEHRNWGATCRLAGLVVSLVGVPEWLS